MLRNSFIIYLLLSLCLPFHVPSAQAADSLFQPDGTCARTFIYRNRTFSVDSSRKLDAEGLRFVLKNNNQSEALLNDYQKNLKTSRWPAYTGTLGVLAIIGGSIYAGTMTNPIAKKDTQLAFLIPGLLLTIGSYTYGQYAIRNNERTLETAVQTYNASAPEKEKIRVGFTPLPNGSGGEIKTEVPF